MSNLSRSNNSATDDTRQLLEDCIHARDLRKSLSTLWLHTRTAPHAYAPDLIILLDDSDPLVRTTAALSLHGLLARTPESATHADALNRCNTILATALTGQDIQVSLWLLRLLIQGSTPQFLLSELRRLCTLKLDDRVVCAAIALDRAGAQSTSYVRLIAAGVGHPLADIGAAAGESLARLARDNSAAERALLHAVHSPDRRRQLDALRFIKASGPAATRSTLLVKQLVEGRSTPWDVRRAAAEALGHIAKTADDDGAYHALNAALNDSDPMVAEGAARGLAAMNRFPPDGAVRLAQRLTHFEGDERGVLLEAILHFGTAALPALPLLLNHVNNERSSDLQYTLGRAIGTCGSASAVEPLLAFVREPDVNAAVAVFSAFRHMDSHGAERLAELLRRESDYVAIGIVVTLIRDMDKAGAILLPVLGELLERETDEDVAGLLITAIYAVGKGAPEATMGLVRCLMLGGDQLAERAVIALRAIGPDLLPLLGDLQRYATPQQYARLARIMDGWPITAPRRLAQLEALDDDVTLERFMYVAELLFDHGPTSYSDMERMIQDRKKAGTVARGCRTSASALRTSIKTIERHFGVTVLDNSPGRKGELSANGRLLMGDVRTYMLLKRGSRQH